MAPAIFLDGPLSPYAGRGTLVSAAATVRTCCPRKLLRIVHFTLLDGSVVQAWLKRIAAVFIEKTVKLETFLISEAHIRRSALVRRRAPVRAPPYRTIPLTYLNNYARLSRS
jgi:hypothetical protein